MRKLYILTLILITSFLLIPAQFSPYPLIANDKGENNKKDTEQNNNKTKDKKDSKDGVPNGIPDGKNKDNDNNRYKDKDKDKDKDKPPVTPPPPPNPTTPAKNDKQGHLKKFLIPYTQKDKDKDKNKNTRHKETDNYHYIYHSNYTYEDTNDGMCDIFWDAFTDLLFGDNGFRYSSYPYNDPDKKGIYIANNNELTSSYNSFGLQLRGHYQKVEKDIWSYGLSGKILFPSGFNLDTYYSQYFEKVNGDTDTMDYLSLHYNFGSLGSNSNIVVEFGAGASFLTDTSNAAHGSLSFQTRMDYYLGKPWGIHLASSYSQPEEQTLFNLDAALGWHSKSLEIFAGYHSLINKKGDTLDGPSFGLALWF